MAVHKAPRIEKGSPFILGANKVAAGYNFAVEVPEKTEASLLLYYKKSKERGF